MKKTTRLVIGLSLAISSLAANAQSLQVNSSMLDPNATLSTDNSLQGLKFESVPAVKNTLGTDAKQQLRDFVQKIGSASGEFLQQTSGGKKNGMQSGTFSFKRPGQFVWNITKPYAQQVISDGKQVYQYDPDLQQVTQRSVGKAIGSSPAALLFGSGTLDQSFNVTVLPETAGMVWLRATPKVPDSGLSRVDIGFANNLPAELRILDSFGQTTSIKLRNFKPNVSLPASAFRFKAPAGVTVVKM